MEIKMKCNYCGSVWNSKSITISCPFCGKELGEQKSDSFVDALKMLIDKYGHNIIETSRIVGLLMDCNPKEVQKNELMRIFVNKGVSKVFLELHREKNNKWDDIRGYCIKKLQEDAFLGYDFACTIVDEIGCAYGYNVICAEGAYSSQTENTKNEILNDSQDKNDKFENASAQETKPDYISFISNKVDGAGMALAKVSVGGLSFKKFDIVTLEDDEEGYMCFAFCKFGGKFFILCEKVKENVIDTTTREGKKYTKHFREYKIYNIDSEGYFEKVVDKTTILAVLPYLSSSLKKSVGYQTIMKKFLPELVSSEDIEAAENALRDFYEIC